MRAASEAARFRLPLLYHATTTHAHAHTHTHTHTHTLSTTHLKLDTQVVGRHLRAAGRLCDEDPRTRLHHAHRHRRRPGHLACLRVL
jgi:hypothetical protein